MAEVKELAKIAGRRIIIQSYDLRNPQAGWQIVDVAGPEELRTGRPAGS